VNSPAELFDLTGKRAVIVGGTGVLGRHFARCLAVAGAEVVVLGRSIERGTRVVDKITKAGGSAEFFAVNVTERASLETVAVSVEVSGGIDILINAAGVNSTAPFSELDEEEWNRLIDVNLSAVFRSCQIFAPQMRNRPDGASIINISSASSGPPLSQVFGYAAAKAAVNNVTQYLARELAPDGIRVNAIVPGFFPAEQNRALLTPERIDSIIEHTAMRRLGEPSELDGVVLWLAAPRASGFVTGALIHVDGGFSAMTI
jgi:NAD(P)-dependent dehydrogenase (short-subunit alcohol dehydrogenase family)